MNRPVLDALSEWQPELAEIRHDLHRHPETAFTEHRTAGVIGDKLASWGVEVTRGVGKTGVVGTLRGEGGGNRAIALRADMDALFIEEANGFEYRSATEGKMHACGHDGHMTMLLGAAKYLAANRRFSGTVHFVFQPAEEGGAGGAKAMIADGLFDRFPCEAIYGMHNDPDLPEGQFAISPGPVTAASNGWLVTFKGTGGHGSAPNQGTDPTIPAANFILAAQTIAGRNVSPLDSAVVSTGYLHGGRFDSRSVIPSEIVLRGTARSYKPDVRKLIVRRLRELAESIAQAYGCAAECEIGEEGSPSVVNSAAETAHAISAATMIAGETAVNGKAVPATWSEDFANYLGRKPGAFVRIGNRGAADHASGLHTPAYDFNDRILPIGAGYWIGLVESELGRF